MRQDVVIITKRGKTNNNNQTETLPAVGVFVYLFIWGVNESQQYHFLNTLNPGQRTKL